MDPHTYCLCEINKKHVLIGGTALTFLIVLALNQSKSTKRRPFNSTNARSSPHLYLPEDHYLLKSKIETSETKLTTKTSSSKIKHSISTSQKQLVELDLRKDLENAVAKEQEVRQQLAVKQEDAERLSTQIQELLNGYENEGNYTGVFGKSKDKVQQERRKFINSPQQAETQELRVKLANLEHESYLTKKALEKSKEQTEMAHQQTSSPRFSSAGGRGNGKRPSGKGTSTNTATHQLTRHNTQSTSHVSLLRDAMTLIRCELVRLDTESLKKIHIALSKIDRSQDSTSIILQQCLETCKQIFIQFCSLDRFVQTSSRWNVTLVQLVNVPQKNRLIVLEHLVLAVAAYDTLLSSTDGTSTSSDTSNDTIENQINSKTSDGYKSNCVLLAALAEFATLNDEECLERANQREEAEKKVDQFERRGSTIALQAIGLLNKTPRASERRNEEVEESDTSSSDEEEEVPVVGPRRFSQILQDIRVEGVVHGAPASPTDSTMIKPRGDQ